MATKNAYKRLTKECLAMQCQPPPYINAKPLEDDILEWHYVLRGPQETPYEGGEYHGILRFPNEYPFKPPSISMITPNGRFQTDTNICMSMSDFHPGLWNPSWSVATILNGLLSFMVDEEATTGSVRMTARDRRILAAKSHGFNLNDPQFKEIFPEFCIPRPAPLPDIHPKQAKQSAQQPDHALGLEAPAHTAADKPDPKQFFTPHSQLRARHPDAGSGLAAMTPVDGASSDMEHGAPLIRETAPKSRSGRWFSFEPCHKFYLFAFIFLYLVAAKLISRALNAPS